MNRLNFFILGVCAMFLGGCNQMPEIDSFEGKEPKADIKSYFNGEIDAWGFIQNRSGTITRRFNVSMVGKWDGNRGTLTEHFTFDDGEKQERIWSLSVNDDETFTGTAGDVVGVAQGQQKGNAINMKYVLKIPVNGKHYDISINDWLILLDNKRLMNISSLTKFGFNVGRLTIFFEKK